MYSRKCLRVLTSVSTSYSFLAVVIEEPQGGDTPAQGCVVFKKTKGAVSKDDTAPLFDASKSEACLCAPYDVALESETT